MMMMTDFNDLQYINAIQIVFTAILLEITVSLAA
jgi:hypothetical protein